MATLPANITSMAQNLAASAAQAGSTATGDAYMKFTKFGDWLYGQEQQTADPGSVWAINPEQFQHGWIAWGTEAQGTDGEMLGDVMVSAALPMPLESDLPLVLGKWSKIVGMQLKCIDGPDADAQTLFKSNSLGGRKVYSTILTAFLARVNDGNAFYVPIVQLGKSFYLHKTYGKIFTPVMDIVGWADKDGNENEPAQVEPIEHGVQQPEPEPEPEPAPEPAAAAPRRRRRG
jgi:hypothetical protein